MMDFTKIKKLFIGGVELKQLFIAVLKNWARYSTESDGTTLYNGIGYKSGYRVRSGGAETENPSSSCTGYIKVKAGDVIRFPADHWVRSTSSAINAFAQNYTNLGQICGDTSNYGYFVSYWKDYGYNTVIKNGDYYEWTVPPNKEGAGVCAYIRVTGAVSDGSKLIVYVNDDKADTQIWKSGYKNWVKYSTEADGVTIYNGGLGYKDGYRLSSSGGESSLTGGTVTGFMPVKAGDIIRIAGCKWYDTSASVNYFIVYDSSFQKVYTGNAKSAYQTTTFIDSMTYDDTTGISTVVLKPGVTGYEHFRISVSATKGENVIVTINEEIA